MDDAVGRARGRSFGSVADVYERSRPGYPLDAVRWMLGADVLSNVAAGENAVPATEPGTVVELAAGTGKLTRYLVGDGHWVVAVEPAWPMLARLARQVRPAFGVQGLAEAIPLVAGCADAVVVGQAFHWFDAEQALAEIGRVLRQGGVLGLVWNRRDESVPWVRHLSTLLARDDSYDEQWTNELVDTIELSRRFGEVEAERFRLWQRLDREGLLQLVASRSYVATLSHEDRQSLLDRVGWLYDATATQPDGLILPYRTICYRVRRL
jgi:SAM-dependent methyltransferase